MLRDEKIELLIEDRINEWVHAAMHEGLEDVLYNGWKGYVDYTDEELNEAFGMLEEANFDEEKAKKIMIEKKRLNL